MAVSEISCTSMRPSITILGLSWLSQNARARRCILVHISAYDYTSRPIVATIGALLHYSAFHSCMPVLLTITPFCLSWLHINASEKYSVRPIGTARRSIRLYHFLLHGCTSVHLTITTISLSWLSWGHAARVCQFSLVSLGASHHYYTHSIVLAHQCN